MLGSLMQQADKLTAGDLVLVGDVRAPTPVRVVAVKVVGPGFLKLELEGGGMLMLGAKIMLPALKEEEL